MNIKVNLQDGTPAQFKTEIVDDSLVVTVVEEDKEEVNLFPKWEELGERISGYYVNSDANIKHVSDYRASKDNENVFPTSDLAKASLATARVSQTYRRYRELVGTIYEPSILKHCGLLLMKFAKKPDWESFYESNKEDLDLISHVRDTVQL